MLLADEPEGGGLGNLRRLLHPRQKLRDRLLVLLEVREVPEGGEVLDHGPRLRRAREALKLPHELAEGEIAGAVSSPRYVAEYERLEGCRTVPMRARRLGGDVFLCGLAGRFVKFGLDGATGFTLVTERRVRVESRERAYPMEWVEVL